MFHLCNILQLVIYRFYYCSFPEQQLVRHAHQGTFHVVFKFGDKLYAIHEQALEKVLADIPFVSDQLAIYEFYERANVLSLFSYVYARGVKFYRTAINFIRFKDSYKTLINKGKEWKMPKSSKGFWRKVPKFSKVCTLFMPKISVPTNQTIHSLGLLYLLFLHQCDLN